MPKLPFVYREPRDRSSSTRVFRFEFRIIMWKCYYRLRVFRVSIGRCRDLAVSLYIGQKYGCYVKAGLHRERLRERDEIVAIFRVEVARIQIRWFETYVVGTYSVARRDFVIAEQATDDRRSMGDTRHPEAPIGYKFFIVDYILMEKKERKRGIEKWCDALMARWS